MAFNHSTYHETKLRRRASQWAQCVCAAAVLAGGCAAVYLHRPAACYARAVAAMESNDIEALQYAIMGLRGSTRYEPQAALATAKLLLAKRLPEPALIVLELAMGDPDTELRALNLSGEALYQLGRFREAGEVWTRVVKRDPENVAALRWLGIAYYDLGAMKQSVTFLSRAAELAPADAGPHRLLGLIYKQLGKHAEAVTAFQESLRRNPRQDDAVSVRFEIAGCLHYLHQDEDAIEVLGSLPPSADVLSRLARCEHACGRQAEAWDTAERALALDERHVGALLLQGKIASEQQRESDAIARWRRVVQIDPGNQEAHYNLAIALQKGGRDDEAKAQRQAADELAKLADELQALTEVAATDPNDVDARMKLGSVCERLGRFRAAREWYRAAIYLDPTNQPAKEALLKLLKSK